MTEEMKYMQFNLLRVLANTGKIVALNPKDENGLDVITTMLKTDDMTPETTEVEWESINYAYKNKKNDTVLSFIDEHDINNGPMLMQKVLLFKATNVIVINGVHNLVVEDTGEVNEEIMNNVKHAFFGCEMIHHVIYMTGDKAHFINVAK